MTLSHILQPPENKLRSADGLMQVDTWTLSECPSGAICSVEVQLAISVPASVSAATMAQVLYTSISNSQLQASCSPCTWRLLSESSCLTGTMLGASSRLQNDNMPAIHAT